MSDIPTEPEAKMNYKKIIIPSSIFLFIILIVIYVLNLPKEYELSNPSEYSEYISGYTTGVVSRHSAIKVKFAQPFRTGEPGEEVSGVFELSPSVEGKAYWIDDYTIEFKPDVPLDGGNKYYGLINIEKAVNADKDIKDFVFRFNTVTPAIEFYVRGIKPVASKSAKMMQVSGDIILADREDIEKIKESVSARFASRDVKVKVNAGSSPNVYGFIVDSLKLADNQQILKIMLDGSSMGIDDVEEKEIAMPASDDFKVLSLDVINEPSQYLSVKFSDFLNTNQDVSGLITVGSFSNLSYEIIENEIKVFFPERLSKEYAVRVLSGIKNSDGKRFTDETIKYLNFEELKPAVRFVGKGNILTSSKEGFILPFESVNLSAVDITITKIFENNMGQFLQVNYLDGNYELYRTGRIIKKRTITLTNKGAASLKEWNVFSLDLNDIIQKEPGAVYNIKLSFKKKYSLYSCGETTEETISEDEETILDSEPQEMSYWDYYDENYNWEERDNPCSSSYYNGSRFVNKNILASDLGIIYKSGNSGKSAAFVTDILTGKPLSGVTLRIVDFKLQQIAEATTKSDGSAEFTLKSKPFLLTAEYSKQRGYLKIEDGNSLSLSNFDVGGTGVKKDLKGFIYGERGVWRPGDSLFLSFILQDPKNNIPENHPLIFKLIDSRGRQADRRVLRKNESGLYVIPLETSQDAPTGNWLAQIEAGGTVFEKSLKIETVKPNRLKIKFDPGSEYLLKDETTNAKLNISWLHGAPGKNIKAKIDLSLSQIPTNFNKFSDYAFDDPTRKFYAEQQTVFESSVDENGDADVKFNINAESAAPGMLKADFTTKAFEPGGDFSTDRFSITYHPFRRYAGIKLPSGDKARNMLLTDKDHTVSLVSVNVNGNPVSDTKMIVRFYKIDWQWWYDQSNGSNSNYLYDSYKEELSSTEVTTVNGFASAKIRVDYPDWGRYLVEAEDLESGHKTGKIVYIDWPGYAGRERSDGGGAAARLALSTDKDKYKSGEEVKVSFPGAEDSKALISIENGSGMVSYEWISLQKGDNIYKFKAKSEMAPNVYVNVMLLQPHRNSINDMPVRLYGYVPVYVENPESKLSPVIEMPSTLKPEQNFTVKVREKHNKKMHYTLAVVDEGLLDLTRFKTPDPWGSFYAKEALGTKTWDIYDYVIGAYGGKLERILGIGGDEDINRPKSSSKLNRFKPVVKFYGPFTLDGGSRTHNIKLPQYIGKIRTMVVASNEGAYGYTEKSSFVKKPVMILGTLPRVLSPGEEVDLPVSVFAMENNVRSVNVTVRTNDKFEIIEQNIKNVEFDKPDDKVVFFKLRVKEKTGAGEVKITAISGNEKANFDIDIEVRNPMPPVTDVYSEILTSGKNWSKTLIPFGLKGTNKCVLEVSAMPNINLTGSIDYLLSYPHGCVEQITSIAFPQLYLENLVSLSKSEKERSSRNIKSAIKRLSSYMTSSGALSYWPGQSYHDDYGSVYAAHFLTEAEKKGFEVPANITSRLKSYLVKSSNEWSKSANRSDLIQAYRLYVLALMKSPESGAMNRLMEFPNLSTEAKYRLAAAFSVAGKPEAALSVIRNTGNRIKSYQELSYTYGSDIRDEAMILETYTIMKKNKEAFEIAARISEKLSKQTYMGTQTTAYSLLALSKFHGAMGKDKTLNFTYSINGGKASEIKTSNRISQIEIDAEANKNLSISIVNTSGGIIYPRIMLQGTPAGKLVDKASNGIELNVQYKLSNGSVIDHSSIPQGTDFTAIITVTNTGTRSAELNSMQLTHYFPSGWEIINHRLFESPNIGKASDTEYQDIRDDRIYTYYKLKRNESKIFMVQLNAAYPGKFFMPAVYTDAMYDSRINARTASGWTEVISDNRD